MEALSGLKTKMEVLKGEMVKVAKEELSAEFKKFFEQWPEAQAIRWTQYTPYFNDGDPCVFRVNEPTFKIGDEGGDDGDGFEYEYGFEGEQRKQASAIVQAVTACEEILQVLFGDHCQVTVWRDKPEAEVEEYSHD